MNLNFSSVFRIIWCSAENYILETADYQIFTRFYNDHWPDNPPLSDAGSGAGNGPWRNLTIYQSTGILCEVNFVLSPCPDGRFVNFGLQLQCGLDKRLWWFWNIRFDYPIGLNWFFFLLFYREWRNNAAGLGWCELIFLLLFYHEQYW